MGNNTNTTRPPAPGELSGEAILEWERVCTELAAAGRLKSTDRALLILWCETWSVHHAVSQHVRQYGSILPAANKVIGKSPWYTVQRECHNALVKLANEMGLTSATRNYDRAAIDDEPEPL